MLTRFIRIQLVVFTVLTLVALVTLGWYYLRLPSQLGIGQYRLYAQLPASGGLYRTANVTYRGITIGKVTDVEPTRNGVRATMSIDDRYKIPVDAAANVHSVSAIGEQYLDLVSTGTPAGYLADGQTITKGAVPAEIGPALDATNHALAMLPAPKISSLLNETSQAVGGLGSALRRLVDSTEGLSHDLDENLRSIDDIIDGSAPILDSQVDSSNEIQRWAANLNDLAAQSAERDQALKRDLTQAAPTADAINAVFSDVRNTLPQTLANLEVVFDMLKRYHANVETVLVIIPQLGSIGQSATYDPRVARTVFATGGLNQPPPCLTGFLPASQWRSPADTSSAPVPSGLYCKIPQDFQGNGVRGARNYPCADVPGKRAATPGECRSNKPYVPAGTNPWYGDPDQTLTCPAPAARCDQPVKPGLVIPAPTVNSGSNPAPADKLPPPPVPTSDPVTRPHQGIVTCNGQQPNPCAYTPVGGPIAIYSPQSRTVVAPDGTRYDVNDSTPADDDGWKQMLTPSPGPEGGRHEGQGH
ncbi:MCE family protein [Mycobacterium avium]|uniref:MCE family protein n=1 Tax=Mycobacterium avium TaxID=1764 RepID=UPI0009C001E2|nr:MlaD family protein [Mycobacterium avium]